MFTVKKYKIFEINGDSNLLDIIYTHWSDMVEFLMYSQLKVREISEITYGELHEPQLLWLQHGSEKDYLDPMIEESDIFACCYPQYYQESPCIYKHIFRNHKGKIHVRSFTTNLNDLYLMIADSDNGEDFDKETDKILDFLITFSDNQTKTQ